MARTSQAQREISRRIEVNQLLTYDAEAAYDKGDGMGLGGVFAQPIVDKMYLDEYGVSPRIKELVAEGLISDRKGVWLQYNQTGNVVTHVSLYKPDTHMPIRYMQLGT